MEWNKTATLSKQAYAGTISGYNWPERHTTDGVEHGEDKTNEALIVGNKPTATYTGSTVPGVAGTPLTSPPKKPDSGTEAPVSVFVGVAPEDILTKKAAAKVKPPKLPKAPEIPTVKPDDNWVKDALNRPATGSNDPLVPAFTMAKYRGAGSGFLNKLPLDRFDNAIRTITVNPLGKALLTGGALGLGAYAAAPALMRMYGATTGQPMADEYGNPMPMHPKDRLMFAAALGLSGAGGSAALSWDKNRSFGGLLRYQPKQVRPMLRKTESALSRSDVIPMSMAKEGILTNQNLSLEMKANALGLLNAIPATGNQPISGADIVSAAVSTGASAAAGAAIGFLTAAALGLPSPTKAAAITGIGNALLHNL